MIPCPNGWTWLLRNQGLSLFPPDGPSVGGIRYTERQKPLLRVTALLDALAEDRSYRVTRRGPIEQLNTYEGEYAAFVEFDGFLDGVPAQRAIGFLFGDDFYTQIAGLARRPDLFADIRAVTRELLLRDRQLLGLRRRRYLYMPPSGWHSCERIPLYTHHYPPGYPNDDVELIAHPAVPRTLFDAGELARIQDVLLPPGGAPVHTVLAHHAAANARIGGDSFLCQTAAGRRRDLVVLGDERYLYPLSVEAPATLMALGQAALYESTQSVLPLPRPRIPHEGNPGVLSHWG